MFALHDYEIKIKKKNTEPIHSFASQSLDYGISQTHTKHCPEPCSYHVPWSGCFGRHYRALSIIGATGKDTGIPGL
jgi:hypothetical protein